MTEGQSGTGWSRGGALLRMTALMAIFALVALFGAVGPSARMHLHGTEPILGFMIGAYLLHPFRRWPAMALAFGVVMGVEGWIVQRGVGETLLLLAVRSAEAMAGAWLMWRLVGKRVPRLTTRDLLVLALVGGVAVPTIGATLGASLLFPPSMAASYAQAWITWWTVDFAAVLMLAPAVLALRPGDPPPGSLVQRTLINLVVLASVGFIAWLAVAARPSILDSPYLLILLPLLLAAFQLSTRNTTVLGCVTASLVMITGVSDAGTQSHPMANILQGLSLLIATAFAVFTGVLVSAVLTRQRADSRESRRKATEVQTILATAMDGFVLVDSSGDIRACNAAFCAMTGFEEKELVGFPAASWVASMTIDEIESAIRTVLFQGARKFDAILRRKDGTTVEVEVGANMVPGTGQICAFIRDITARKAAERTVEETHAFVERLARATPDLLYVRDLRTDRLVYMNRDPAEIFGSAPDEMTVPLTLLRAKWQDRFDPAEAASYHQRLASRPNEESEVQELRMRHADGHWIWVQVRESVFTRDADGTPLEVIGLLQNVTEEHESRHKLAASLREKEVLLKEIHHRVKNNLQVVSSLLNIQSGKIADPFAREALRASRTRVRSMALVHERLSCSTNLADVDFGMYLRSVADELMAAYGRDGVTCHVTGADIHLSIESAVPCGLIAHELVLNALRHAFPEGSTGTVEVQMRQIGDRRFQLVVGDDGIGMTAATAMTPNPRSMGMLLVSSLVQQLEGNLTFSAAHGARFVLEFDDALSWRAAS